MVLREESDAADGAVESWLERLEAAGATATPSRAHVRYVVTRREVYYVPRIEVEAYAATGQRDGALSALRAIDILNVGKLGTAYATSADRTIARLAGVSGAVRPSLSAPSPLILAALLDAAITTGRLYWQSASNPALQRQPIEGRIAWRTGEDGRQRPTLADRPRAVLLACNPVWYVDPIEMRAGPVDLGIAPVLAAAAVSAPALTARQAERSQIAWRRAISRAAADAPVTERPAGPNSARVTRLQLESIVGVAQSDDLTAVRKS